VSLLDQMAWVERLVRRPDELAAARAVAGADGEVLRTVDAERLAAVHETFAELVVGRWWAPGFPASLAALRCPRDGPAGVGRRLVREAAFEEAVGEDETGRALIGGALDALEGGRLEGPPWIRELLAYEYLLAVGLPRRARGQAPDAALEARLLPPEAAWLAGAPLATEVLVCPFGWPVAELAGGELVEAEPDPHDRLLFVSGGEVLDAAPPPEAADALQLLAGGADEGAVLAALGPDGAAAVAWLREAGALPE